MVGLFVGSEGTLGVVTEVTLRLRPALAGTPRTIVGAFPNLVTAGEAVSQITRRGLGPSVLKLLDQGLPDGRRGLEAPGPGGQRGGAAAGPGGYARGLRLGKSRTRSPGP